MGVPRVGFGGLVGPMVPVAITPAGKVVCPTTAVGAMERQMKRIPTAERDGRDIMLAWAVGVIR